jgi:hypothetical protein
MTDVPRGNAAMRIGSSEPWARLGANVSGTAVAKTVAQTTGVTRARIGVDLMIFTPWNGDGLRVRGLEAISGRVHKTTTASR